MGLCPVLFCVVLKKKAWPRVIGDGPVVCGSGAFNFLHALGFETAGKGLWVIGVLQGDISVRWHRVARRCRKQPRPRPFRLRGRGCTDYVKYGGREYGDMCRESLRAFAKDMSLASLQVAEGDFADTLIGRNGQKAVVVRKGKAR